MTRVWQFQDAKNKFSEVVAEAIEHRPQLITQRGVAAVVVLSYADYRKLVLAQKPLSAFFRDSPLAGLDVDLSRDQSGLRKEIAPGENPAP